MIKDTSAQDSVVVPQRRNNIKRLLLITLVLVAVALSAHAILNTESAAKSVDRASVQIATVERGDLVRDIAATGRIVAANAPQVYSPEEGLVTLLVRAGDTVSKGQQIARVDSPQLQNQLQQERSELARLEGELARKSLDARRQTLQLNKQLDLAKVELKAAERESRRANKSIKTNIISQYTNIPKAVANFSGYLLNQTLVILIAVISNYLLYFICNFTCFTGQPQCRVNNGLFSRIYCRCFCDLLVHIKVAYFFVFIRLVTLSA